MTPSRHALVLFALLLAGCTIQRVHHGPDDAGDAGGGDAARDAAEADAGAPDAGRDGGRTDAGAPDAGRDAGPTDAGADSGPSDAGSDAWVDPCATVTCGDCESCVDGTCEPLTDGTGCTGGVCHDGSCCTGCWDGSTCRGGTSASYCGSDGASCAGCGPCETCSGGSCVPVSDGTSCSGGQCYDGSCCTGCWDGSTCRGGTSTTYCGSDGASCAGCGPCETCSGGSCVPVSDGTSCSGGQCYDGSCCTGCWDGSTCRGGTSTSACGTGGGACATCGCSSDSCTDGACEPLGGGAVSIEVSTAGHQCAILADQRLYCWGRNDVGQLGLGDIIERTVPVQVVPGSSWSSVSAGELYTCAISASTSQRFCWGGNDWGQLGVGDTSERHVPTAISGTGSSQIAASRFHTCSPGTFGSMDCWGSREGTGLDPDMTYTTPTVVSGTSPSWTQVSAGNQAFSCGLRTDGSLWCWGLINGASSPTRIGTESGWSHVSAGELWACGIRSGQLWCWGETYGSEPVRVGSASDWTAVSAGYQGGCGIRAGRLYCWGWAGEYGSMTPSRIGSASNWIAVDSGREKGCGIRDTGEVYCWSSTTTPSPARVCF